MRSILRDLTRVEKKLLHEDFAAMCANVSTLAEELSSHIDSCVKEYNEAAWTRRNELKMEMKKLSHKARISPFILFCSEKRRKVRENPSKKLSFQKLSFPDQARKLGRKWKRLPDVKKAPYLAEAAKLQGKEMERRANLLREYQEKGVFVDDGSRKVSRFSSFMLFCKDMRPGIQARNKKNGENPRACEWGKELGQMWKVLEQSKKDEYKVKADKLKKEYLESLSK